MLAFTKLLYVCLTKVEPPSLSCSGTHYCTDTISQSLIKANTINKCHPTSSCKSPL